MTEISAATTAAVCKDSGSVLSQLNVSVSPRVCVHSYGVSVIIISVLRLKQVRQKRCISYCAYFLLVWLSLTDWSFFEHFFYSRVLFGNWQGNIAVVAKYRLNELNVYLVLAVMMYGFHTVYSCVKSALKGV